MSSHAAPGLLALLAPLVALGIAATVVLACWFDPDLEAVMLALVSFCS